jgi:hypothetical protein
VDGSGRGRDADSWPSPWPSQQDATERYPAARPAPRAPASDDWGNARVPRGWDDTRAPGGWDDTRASDDWDDDGRRSSQARPSRRLWGMLPGGLGVCIVIGAAAIGALATVVVDSDPGLLLGVFLLSGTVLAVLGVQPKKIYLIIPAPALAYLFAAGLAGMIHDRAQDTSKTALLLNGTQWIASGFTVMIVATVIALVTTVVRWPRAGRRSGRPRGGSEYSRTGPGSQRSGQVAPRSGPGSQRSASVTQRTGTGPQQGGPGVTGNSGYSRTSSGSQRSGPGYPRAGEGSPQSGPGSSRSGLGSSRSTADEDAQWPPSGGRYRQDSWPPVRVSQDSWFRNRDSGY